jgi:hypothetical protein
VLTSVEEVQKQNEILVKRSSTAEEKETIQRSRSLSKTALSRLLINTALTAKPACGFSQFMDQLLIYRKNFCPGCVLLNLELC